MKVVIVPNGNKEAAVAKSIELANWLEEHGATTATINADDIIDKDQFSESAYKIIDGVDLYVTLGGDGTILSTAQLVFRQEAPVLGFNFGHLGFLTGGTQDVVIDGVAAALDGKLERERRYALDVTIEARDGSRHRYTVLNEVAITRGITGKMINFDVNINDALLSHMRGDGVIVASPTGSTAYSLSAGGPIISPTLSCMAVVALAPHSLVSRALVIDDNEKVVIIPEDKSNKDCSVFVDGHLVRMKRSPAKVSVSVSDNGITLLRYNVPEFTRLASRVFFGSTND